MSDVPGIDGVPPWERSKAYNDAMAIADQVGTMRHLKRTTDDLAFHASADQWEAMLDEHLLTHEDDLRGLQPWLDDRYRHLDLERDDFSRGNDDGLGL